MTEAAAVPLFALEQEGEGRFTLPVTADLCVGPPGRTFLFGGAGLAMSLAAIRRMVGAEPICATAHFVSYARLGDRLAIDVAVARAGSRVGHATASVSVDGRAVLSVVAASGGLDAEPARQWARMPDLPPPERCVPAAPWPEQGGGLLARLDVRAAPDVDLSRPQPDGRLRLWLRLTEERPVDAETLALFGDFVPAAVAAALGTKGGGNSLDNTLRLIAIPRTRWVAADARVHAIGRGMAHGDIRLFAEDGALMAVGSQSLVVRHFG